MLRPLIQFLVFIISVAMISSCSLPPDLFCHHESAVTFQNTIRPILKEHCAGCHSSDAVEPQFPTFMDGVDDPTSWAASLEHLGKGYLHFRVTDTTDADEDAIMDYRMPQGGTLPPEEIQLYRDWYYDNVSTQPDISTNCAFCHNFGAFELTSMPRVFDAGNLESLRMAGVAFIDFVVNELHDPAIGGHSHAMPPFTELSLSDLEKRQINKWFRNQKKIREENRDAGSIDAHRLAYERGYGLDQGQIDFSIPATDAVLSPGDTLSISYSANIASGSGDVVFYIDDDPEGLDGRAVKGCEALGSNTVDWTIGSTAQNVIEDLLADSPNPPSPGSRHDFHLYGCVYDRDNVSCRYADQPLTLAYASGLRPVSVPDKQVDKFDLLRRLTIDHCKRLPTLDEISDLHDNLATTTTDDLVDYVVDQCAESDEFAELMALMVDDFVLPSADPYIGKNLVLTVNPITVSVDGVDQTFRYIYGSRPGWEDCGDGLTSMTAAEFNNTFELVTPYWDTSPVHVCRGPVPSTVTAPDPNISATGVITDPSTGTRYYSMTNSNETLRIPNWGAVTPTIWLADVKNCRSEYRFPCGCGDNLRLCSLQNPLPDELDKSKAVTNVSDLIYTNGTGAERALENHSQREANMLVQHIVKSGRPFTDIFTTTESVRTSRLQQYMEALHAVPEDQSCINNGVADTTTSLCGSGLRDFVPSITPYYSHEWLVDYFPANTDAQAGLDAAYREDWQVVERQPFHSGILTMAQLLIRQPTEPNFANQVYRFWMCEDIGWRADRDLVVGPGDSDDSIDGQAFTKLETTLAANEALTNSDCFGCHLTVNSMAAFRNRWSKGGFYNHPSFGSSPNADGLVALDTSLAGSDIVGLGAMLAEHPKVHECIARRVHRFVTGEEPDAATLNDHLSAFDVGGSRDIRKLFRSVLESDDYQRPR